MQIDLTALPEDSGVLQSMIRDIITTTMQRDTQVTELTVENDKLRALIQKLLRHRFGRPFRAAVARPAEARHRGYRAGDCRARGG